MTTQPPPTFDRFMSDLRTQAKTLIDALHQMEQHVDKQTDQSSGTEREECERVAKRLWQAIGMAEGMLHMLELAERQRPRSLV